MGPSKISIQHFEMFDNLAISHDRGLNEDYVPPAAMRMENSNFRYMLYYSASVFVLHPMQRIKYSKYLRNEHCLLV